MHMTPKGSQGGYGDMAFSRAKDLTRGNPMKLVIGFALPLFVGVLFQQLYSFVDTAVVGRFLGPDKLGAVGATSSVNFMIVGFCLGICSGFSVPVSQRFGAGELSEMRRFIMNAVYLTCIIGLALGIVTAVLCPQILQLMNTPEDFIQDSIAYIRVIFAIIPITMVYNIAAGILRALGDSKTPVLFLVMAALVNVVLDLAFILLFDMGIAGAAWATAISQLLSGIGCVWVLVKRFEIIHPRDDEKQLSMRHVKTLVGIGIPMGLQFTITAIGAVVLQISVNGTTKEAVTAIAAGGKLSCLFTCIYDALSSTMATFAGQNLGAGKPRRITQGLWATAVIGTVWSMLATAVLWLFGRECVGMFVDSSETVVTDLTCHYLRMNSAFYIPLLFVNIVRLSIQGMGATRVAMMAGLMEMAARSAVGLLLVPQFGFDAACLANPSAWIAADIFLVPCYIVLIRRAIGEKSEARLMATEELCKAKC